MPLSVRAQIVVGTLASTAVLSVAFFYSARQTYRDQVRILGQQMPIVAQTLADALSADSDEVERAAHVLAGLQVTADSAAILADADGRVVAASGPPEVIATKVLADMPRLSTSLDIDGVERVWGVERQNDTHLTAAVARPTRIAWDRAVPIFRRNLTIIAFATALVTGIISVLVAYSTRSIRRLEAMATRVARGDLSTPETFPMASRELHHLQATMADMITRVRELQDQVVRQERLAAIGTLVSGVAHEISNPLQSILGSTEVLQSRTDLPAEVQTDLNVIQQESMRAGAIIRNLTRFTRQQPASPGPMKLTEIVGWLTEMWTRRLVEQGITLEVDEQSTRVAHAVATELQQVALNFLVNAEYAVLHGGQNNRRVVVRTRDTDNGFVKFEVEDSGPGVPAEHEGSVFLPFFTTKPVGEGTGLGLSVSYGIIHSHGGRIGYDRGAMGGARFYFEVPAQ